MGVTQRRNNMLVSYLHVAISPFLLVCTPSLVNAAGSGNVDPPGGSALDPSGGSALDSDETEFIKTEIERLSNMTKEGLQPSGVDLHQLMSLRLNIETPADEGRDGLSDFPGSPTIIIQANGEVKIKGREEILLSQDGNFNDAMFDSVFGEYRKTFEGFLVKQEGLMRQIKKLQKQVEREQKGPITETFAERKFTFYQNGTISVSLDICEPECFTDRAFFDGEIDEEIFNDIFPQDVLAALTVEEANGLDTKADSNSPEADIDINSPEAEPEIGAVTGSGADDKNFATAATLVFILTTMYFS